MFTASGTTWARSFQTRWQSVNHFAPKEVSKEPFGFGARYSIDAAQLRINEFKVLNLNVIAARFVAKCDFLSEVRVVSVVTRYHFD
jgi:hypothetical protein